MKKNMLFQFHYGTIKSIMVVLLLNLVRYFNSTMVRLKAVRQTDSRTVENDFNSTMVRLKGCKGRMKLETHQFQFHYGTIKRC